MRRLIAIMLTVALVLSMAVPAMATEGASTSVYVGVITLFAATGNGSSSGAPGLGHAFLSFKNITSTDKLVGVYSVAPGEEITFGTWGNTSSFGNVGVWYNLESYLMGAKRSFANRVSLSVAVTQSDLNAINAIINNPEPYHLTDYNCVNFALDIYYETPYMYVLSIGNPAYPVHLMNSIQTTGEYETGKSVDFSNDVGYAENGEFKSVTDDVLADIYDELRYNDAEIMEVNPDHDNHID